ncbi:hypothetical protein ACIQLJ_04060 [Microbacterium sp. NPDC091313]
MRRRVLTGVAIAAGAAVLAAGLGVWVLLPRSTPEDTARAFLDALESGDADAVFALVDGGRDAHADAADALTGATERISGARVVSVETAGDGAAVDADVTLAGQRYPMAFELARVEGRWVVASGFLDDARLTASLGDAVTVGDAVIAEGDVQLLPARYEVTGAPADLLDGSVDVDVAPERAAEATVETALSTTALAEAQGQIDAYAAACTSGGPSVPAACGLRVPWAADFTAAISFAYRIDRSPQLRVSPDGAAFVAGGGDVVVTVSGAARDGGPAERTYRDDAWTLRGDVHLGSDGLVLSVR